MAAAQAALEHYGIEMSPDEREEMLGQMQAAFNDKTCAAIKEYVEERNNPHQRDGEATNGSVLHPSGPDRRDQAAPDPRRSANPRACGPLRGSPPLARSEPARMSGHASPGPTDITPGPRVSHARSSPWIDADGKTTQDIGFEVVGNRMVPVITRGTQTPVARMEVFSTETDDQRRLEIHVLRGASDAAADCCGLGYFHVQDLPPRPRGTLQIHVTFAVDSTGRVSLKAVDAQTKREFFVIRQPEALVPQRP
jgi:hypothetical protein